MRRLTGVVAATMMTLTAILSGCSLLVDRINHEIDNTGGEPARSSASPLPADVAAMTAAYDAFAKELGSNAGVLGVSYSATRSVAYPGPGAQALVHQGGTLTRTWDAMPGATTDKTLPLAQAAPTMLLSSLAAKGVCSKAVQVGTHVYWGGWRLVDATCLDGQGTRVVQVTEAGEELPPVDLATRPGLTRAWQDLLAYGPQNLPISRYEYVFTPADGREPGVYLKSGTLLQWRLAKPGKTPVFNEAVEQADPPGPTTTFAALNAASLWEAYDLTSRTCGTVDRLAVGWRGATPVIVGTGKGCTVTTDAAGKRI